MKDWIDVLAFGLSSQSNLYITYLGNDSSKRTAAGPSGCAPIDTSAVNTKNPVPIETSQINLDTHRPFAAADLGARSDVAETVRKKCWTKRENES